MNPKPYLVSAALMAAVSFSYADERVQQSQLPAPVQQALTSSSVEHGKVKEINKRTVDGKVVYDVEFEKDNAINPRLRISEDGRVLTTGRMSSMADDAAAAGRNTAAAASSTAAGVRRDVDATRRDLSATGRELRSVDTESMLKLEELPAAVRATIQKEAAGREIADIDEETWNKQKVYEVEFREPGLNSQIHVAADGKLVKADDKKAGSTMKNLFMGTQLEDTPAAVQATIKREVGNRRIADIDKERRTGRVVYEVEVEDTDGKFQLHIAENGSIVKDDRVAAGRTLGTAASNTAAMASSTAEGVRRDVNATRRDLSATGRDLRRVDTESMLKLEELPAAVRATIEKEAAGREIADIDEETWNKQKVYEVEFREPGLNSQIHVAADGKLVKADDKRTTGSMKNVFMGTQLEDTPAAVQATIKREVGNRRIADIDKERRTGRVVYEVEVDDNEGKFQLHIAENGSIVKDDRVAE